MSETASAAENGAEKTSTEDDVTPVSSNDIEPTSQNQSTEDTTGVRTALWVRILHCGLKQESK